MTTPTTIVAAACSASGYYSTCLPAVNADGGALKAILQIIFGVLAAIAVLMITIGGLRYVTSGGSPEGTKQARGTILFALVGLVIALSAEALVSFSWGESSSMKRFTTALVLAIALLAGPTLAFSGSAAAVDVFQPCTSGNAGNTSVCKDVNSQSAAGTNPIVSGIKVIIQIIALVVGLVSVVFLIVSGIRLATSGGDPQAVAAARGGIIYALVGIIIVVVAEALVSFVLNKLQ